MNKLLLRTVSGAVYVGLIVVSLAWGGLWAFTLLCCFLAAAGMLELQKMTKGTSADHRVTLILDVLIGLSIVASLYLCQDSLKTYLLIGVEVAFLILLRAVMQLYIVRERPATDIALSMFSIGYVAVPLAIATVFANFFGAHRMLLVFVMIWLNDTGAFLVGSAIGSHRLFERLSPKKSWEGFWGGLLFCVATGWLAAIVLPQYFGGTPWKYIVLGFIVPVFATWGDLFESMIKRSVGVKDSGRIMPGHGGILDRIDSLLFVAPASALYFFFITIL